MANLTKEREMELFFELQGKLAGLVKEGVESGLIDNDVDFIAMFLGFPISHLAACGWSPQKIMGACQRYMEAAWAENVNVITLDAMGGPDGQTH